MAVNAVDPNTPFGALILDLVAKSVEVRSLALRIKQAAAETGQNPTTDWSRLEGGDFGAPSGKGEVIFGNVNAIYIALSEGDAANAIATLDRGA